MSGAWATRDNFSPSGQETNITFGTEPQTRALAVTRNTNSTYPGAAFVFYVAQNGSAQCLSVLPDGNDGIVARPGPTLPPTLQNGHVLTLAAGVSSDSSGTRSQVGVLISNGTVYYDLFFSFFDNSTWSSPKRMFDSPIHWLCSYVTLSSNCPCASTSTGTTAHLTHVSDTSRFVSGFPNIRTICLSISHCQQRKL